MEYLTIKKHMTFDKGKDGTILKDKRGNQYWRVAIKTNEYGDSWLSGFCKTQEDPKMTMKEGSRYQLVVESTGKYLNFDLPKPIDLLDAEVDKISRVQKVILEHIGITEKELEKILKEKENGKDDIEEPIVEDIPDIF